MKKYRLVEEETRGIGGKRFRRTSVVELADKVPAPPNSVEVPANTEPHEWREEEVAPAAPAMP